MASFAKVDKKTGLVENVIVATPAAIAMIPEENGKEWIQTSYNTFAGEHREGGIPLRKNFASVGFTYDYVRDAFIPPKPYESWVLDEQTCLWVAPKAKPEGNYVWNEEKEDWEFYGDTGDKQG